jgi:hypothetical protein
MVRRNLTNGTINLCFSKILNETFSYGGWKILVRVLYELIDPVLNLFKKKKKSSPCLQIFNSHSFLGIHQVFQLQLHIAEAGLDLRIVPPRRLV